MAKRNIFITGTDTNIGKTYVSHLFLQAMNQKNLQTLAMKPVASGCFNGQNEDALLLNKTANLTLDYSCVNPFAYEPPIAPHIAADRKNTPIDFDELLAKTQALIDIPADFFLIEGAGGLMVPLNHQATWIDYIQQLNLDVILVIGIKLGCINHALLTQSVMKYHQLNGIGWVANEVEPGRKDFDEIVNYLSLQLTMPLIDLVRHDQSQINMHQVSLPLQKK